MVGKGKIPDRWGDYTPVGKIIGNTRMFALKVPLHQAFSSQLKKTESFTPEIVIKDLENLGLIIDLTNTDRYYCGLTEFVKNGILYQKIKCQGHVVPSADVVTKFFAIMDTFLDNHKDRVVGVHCTHGLNRTGYLVCRYMIQRLGYAAKEAIKEFNSHRGHNMERANYIDDLTKAQWVEISKVTDFDLSKCDIPDKRRHEPRERPRARHSQPNRMTPVGSRNQPSERPRDRHSRPNTNSPNQPYRDERRDDDLRPRHRHFFEPFDRRHPSFHHPESGYQGLPLDGRLAYPEPREWRTDRYHDPPSHYEQPSFRGSRESRDTERYRSDDRNWRQRSPRHSLGGRRDRLQESGQNMNL